MTPEQLAALRAAADKQKPERRIIPFKLELRDGANGGVILRGHAAVFDKPADLGWFTETVKRGAFRTAIAGQDDVRALFNHDVNFVLGRSVNKTLRLTEDNDGLAVEIDAPNTQTIRDLVIEPIRRGDVNQMSFAFQTRTEEVRYEGDRIFRDLTDVALYDVSPVTFPAYKETDISARSLESVFKEFRRGPEPPPTDAEAWKRQAEARRLSLLIAD